MTRVQHRSQVRIAVLEGLSNGVPDYRSEHMLASRQHRVRSEGETGLLRRVNISRRLRARRKDIADRSSMSREAAVIDIAIKSTDVVVVSESQRGLLGGPCTD